MGTRISYVIDAIKAIGDDNIFLSDRNNKLEDENLALNLEVQKLKEKLRAYRQGNRKSRS